jgi:hypothetical protein
LASFLNITPNNKLDVIQMHFPIMKNEEELTREVIQYRDIGSTEANKLKVALDKIEPMIVPEQIEDTPMTSS